MGTVVDNADLEAYIEENGEPTRTKTHGPDQTVVYYEEVNATDKAVELAEENDLDLSSIEGSGEGGRILVKDVKAALKEEEDG